MLGIAHRPSGGILQKGLLSLRVVGLAIAAALLFAGSASAAGTDPAEGPISAEAQGPPGAEASKPLPNAPASPGDIGVGLPAAPEGSSAGVPLPAAPEVSLPPAPEVGGGEGPASTPVGPEQSPVSGPEPSPPKAGEGPPSPPSPEVPSPGASGSPPPQTGAEGTPAEAIAQQTPESSLSPTAIVDMPVALQHAETHDGPGALSAAAGPGGPGGPAGSPEVASTVASAAEIPTAFDRGPVSVGAPAALTSAERAGGFSCELAAFGGHLTANCSAGWLGAQRLPVQSSVGLATAEASLVAAASPPAGGGHGGSGGGSAPVSPTPGPPPAPSGASGSAAGASGLALSGFLTLAGLLLLGAPRATRRLRLSCEPWLTACFVLIPERPG
jgi:hypothetical protein